MGSKISGYTEYQCYFVVTYYSSSIIYPKRCSKYEAPIVVLRDLEVVGVTLSQRSMCIHL